MKIFRKKIGFIFIALLLLMCLGIFGWGCSRKSADTEPPSVAESEANLEKDEGILSIDGKAAKAEDEKQPDPKDGGKSDQADKGKVNPAHTSENGESVSESPVIIKEDYSRYFDGINGCAVFYNSRANTYHIYQEEMASVRVSPCSTFKVVSTLIGLEEGLVDSEESRMGYDGTIYENTTWNQDLNLKEAFQKSCVWYYRKLLDQVGEEKVKKWVDALDYGNCDIGQWKGDGSVNGGAEELNGFWLESSLEISAREQTEVLARIFDGNTEFQEKYVSMLRDMMKTGDEDACGIEIYGKTGTGQNGNHADAWYVGMTVDGKETNYFAVRLAAAKESCITGADAKKIALRIIHK